MLKTLRKKENLRWIMWATIILVGVSFVFFYGWSSLSSRQQMNLPFAAKIDRYEISIEQFQQQYNDTIVELRNSYKQDINEDVIKQLRLPEKVLNQMIGQYLMLREAKRMGVRVDDAEVTAVIMSNQNWSPGGRFDSRLYQESIERQGKSVAGFEAELRNEIMQRKLQFLLQDFVKVSDTEVREAFRKQYETMKVVYLDFTPQEFVQLNQVSDANIQNYYDLHKVEFTIPPQYRAQYLTIPVAELEKNMKSTDTEIQQYYEINQGEFTVPEQVHARHIIVQVPQNASPEQDQIARTKIMNALSRIRAGEDFAKVAKEVSEDASAKNGGDLGSFGRGEMEPAFEQVAFSTPVGKVSDIFRTKYGYHIVKVEAKQEAHIKQLPEVKSQVAKLVVQQKADTKAKELAEDILRDSVQTPNLGELAKKYKLAITDTGFFSGTQIPGLGKVPEFLQTIENLSIHALGSPMKTDKGYLVVQLTDKKDSTIPLLVEVKEKIRYQLALAEAAKTAATRVQQAESLIQKGIDLPEVAKQVGIPLKTAEPFTYFGYIKNENASREFANAAFMLPVGKISGVIEDTNLTDGQVRGYFILRVVDKSGIDEGKYLAEKDKVVKALLQARQKEAFQDWIDALTKRAKVQRNEKFIQGYYSS